MRRITLIPLIVIAAHQVQARVSLLPAKPIVTNSEAEKTSSDSRYLPSGQSGPAPAGSSRLRGSAASAPSASAPAPTRGNLPSYLRSRARSEENPIILPAENPGLRLADLNTGDVLSATIPDGLLAYHGSKTPVRALITKGKFKGGAMIGEASLEKNSKRIVISFKNIRPPRVQDIFELQAHAVDARGLVGIEGEYHSDEPWFFAGEFLSAAASGLMSSQVEKDQNQYGNYVPKPGIDNAAKSAGATAASRTADHFAEKIKAAPEYSVLQGPIPIKVVIITPAKLTK